MPRIRSLKPEHKQHRKVGTLSDREYRVWVGMLTEADDEGRLVGDASQLRALIFAYHPKVSLRQVETAVARLADLGLVRLYAVDGTRYVDFPSWKDHQRMNRPTASKLPPYKHSVKTHGGLTEDSRSPHGGLTPDRRGSEGIGEERIGEDRKGGEREGRETRTVALATSSNNDHDPESDRPALKQEAAPATWFNDCLEGQRRECLNTKYVDQVDGARQCDVHAKARRDLEDQVRQFHEAKARRTR